MDPDKREKERRRQQAFERLGTTKPQCVRCGESDPRCFEQHHVAGRRYSDAAILVCSNCHGKLSDAQKDHPKPTANPPTSQECIGHFLLGLADFFAELSERLCEFGRSLTSPARTEDKPTGAGHRG
jgi:hypothetical protein